MKKAISIPNAPAPVGPYSQAILSGNMLFVSGQIPLNPTTGKLVNDSIEASTHQVMQNIYSLLTAAGFEWDNVVKCSIFLKNLNDFSTVNAIYATYFNAIPPARETVEVARLPLDVSIEISCIAAK
ncbi:MAG: RidA family protein [Crocinitomicaceae bacterium]